MVLRSDRKPTYTPFAKHFNTVKPLFERFTVVPAAKRRPPGRSMLRLSFGAVTPKQDMSVRDLYDHIQYGNLNAKYIFPDTGFITSAMLPQFWGLAAGREITFTEMTVGELSWVVEDTPAQLLPAFLAAAGHEAG